MAEQQHKTEKSGAGGPSRSQIIAVVTLLPVSGTLLFLAGITLTGTLIGLAVATPLFILFSPVLVPAALVMGLAVMGFLTSGAFGITALSSLSWMANYIRRVRGTLASETDQAKHRMQEAMGQKARDMQGKGQEATGGGGRT